jgi:AcrR family transcriptional regulator/DNA-binding MarR family transcriptional regulator
VSARDGGARAPWAYNGVVRSQLGDLQRARILSAMFEVASERGASTMTVAHIVERAGVSRRTFYEVFNDREDCLLAAFEDAVSYASERVLAAYGAEKTWRERVRAGLVALLSFLDEQPLIGRLLIVESDAGGPATQQRRAEIIAALTRVIERGREYAKASSTIPPLTGEGVVGGTLVIIHSRLVEKGGEPLVQLTNTFMSMIVLPYLGADVARKEFDRPTPASSRKPQAAEPSLSDPFKDARIRITYRTVRVLTAIAEDPGASNSAVADTAEIKDQGQISKLLTRLERVGMVSNTGLGPRQGAPNAWTLTASGRQVVATIRAAPRAGPGKTSDEPSAHPHPAAWPHNLTSNNKKRLQSH